MAIRVLDMFCGMSAFRTAAEQLGGFSFVGYCDNDPTAVAAYRTLYNTEGEYFCNDARAVNTNEIPDFDLLVGGFPCVAFSSAGARKAFDDPRGTLFFELARILEAKHPAFFIFENVPPIRTISEGRVFTAILSEISQLGVFGIVIFTATNGRGSCLTRTARLKHCLKNHSSCISVITHRESLCAHSASVPAISR